MADDQRLDIRIYCPQCDSYKPVSAFKKGETYCIPCRTQYQKLYVRNIHDRAIQALGGMCMECTLPYIPLDPERRMFMMKMPSFNDWMGYPDCQYQQKRDHRILKNPTEAKKHIRMLCKKCKPAWGGLSNT